MSETSIEWTDRSINPIRARNRATGAVGHFCEKISPGCGHCYACAWNKRVRPSPSGGPSLGTGLDFIPQNRAAVEIFLDDAKLEEVVRRKKPTKYFWCDMTDIFGEWVSDEMLNRCFAVMAQTPQHTHQILTKRADRMRAFMERSEWAEVSNQFSPTAWLFGDRWPFPGARPKFYGSARPHDYIPWPLPNVWLGVSVEDQKRADERIPHLLRTPAAVRFLSVEPLLGPVTFRPSWLAGYDYDGRGGSLRYQPRVDWAIVGGESGPGARPCHIKWIRDVQGACRDAAVPCFVKQLGANVIDRNDAGFELDPERPESWPEPVDVEHDVNGFREEFQGADCRVVLRDGKGGKPEEWPIDLRVRQFPDVRQPGLFDGGGQP